MSVSCNFNAGVVFVSRRYSEATILVSRWSRADIVLMLCYCRAAIVLVAGCHSDGRVLVLYGYRRGIELNVLLG